MFDASLAEMDETNTKPEVRATAFRRWTLVARVKQAVPVGHYCGEANGRLGRDTIARHPFATSLFRPVRFVFSHPAAWEQSRRIMQFNSSNAALLGSVARY